MLQVPADSLRHVIGQVFARPEYQWVERRRLVSWLARQWHNLIEWLNRLSAQHPVGFDIGLALVVVALVALLVHMGYVMWRIVRPAARTGQTKTPVGARVAADAAAHLAYAEELARAGRYAEARLTDRGRASLAGLVAQLYRHLFGAVPCDAGEYESFGDAAQELARGQYVVPA